MVAFSSPVLHGAVPPLKTKARMPPRGPPAAGLVDAPQEVPRTLWGDHPDVDRRRRLDPGEPDVEAVGEHQQLAGPKVRLDLRVVDGLLGRIGDEDHDDVGRANRVGHAHDPQPGLLGKGPALRALGQPDDDVDARFVEV